MSKGPTNEERRASAKRNLDLQVEQRAKEARKRRYTMIGAATGALLLAIAATTTVVLRSNKSDGGATAVAEPAPAVEHTRGAPGELPKFVPSPSVGANCQYPASKRPASKKVEPPRAGKVPTEEAEVSVSMMTDQGPIGLMLANAESPCTVNSFVSLGAQNFFKDTTCHRLTTSPTLGVLQCGDPTGDGTGGPGYEFANEYPTDQYKADDPAARQPVTYPRGTVAMANAGPGTNGSQFFLVYKDSVLPPQYTVFGTIQNDGLATLDKIAAAGVQGGGEDGAPATKVLIKSILVD